MMRTRLMYATTLSAVLCIALPTSARAQTEDADALVHEGVALRREGHDEEALDRFRRAYEIAHRVNALGQMGFAEQALGLWVAAEQHVREARAQSTEGWVIRNQALLDQAYAAIEEHVGQLEVRGPAGAELLVDGRHVATLPLSEAIHLLPSTVSIEVRANGFRTETRTVVVTAGQVSRETVELVSNAPPLTITGTPVHSAPIAHPSDRQANPSNAGPIALGIGGAVAIAGGVIAAVVRENIAVRYNSTCDAPDSVSLTTDCRDMVSAHGLAVAGTVAGLVVGAGLVAAGIGLFVSSAGHREAHPNHAFTCGPGPGDVGASCQVTF